MVTKQMRVCGSCKKPGHNQRTCKQLGRQILEQENQKVDRQPDELGNIPKAGLWLISLERKKIAGKISQVKGNGMVLWKGIYGELNEHSTEAIKESKYLFLELEPEHLNFKVSNK